MIELNPNNLFVISQCTDSGEVYTWGWKECVPLAKVPLDLTTGGNSQKDVIGKQSGPLTEQGVFLKYNSSRKLKLGIFIVLKPNVV